MGRETLKLLESKEQAPSLVALPMIAVVPPNNIHQNLFNAYAIIGIIL
jgi:hypothetical protein